jgi:hypothetical protein
MTYVPDQVANTGSFVPTTNIWDVSQLAQIEVTSPEFKELLIRLYQNINNIAQSLNIKDTGMYVKDEFNTGIQLFNPTTNDPLQNRPVFRKLVDTGTLNAGVKNVPHGLTIASTWQFVSIRGAATDNVGGNYYPLPSSTISVVLDNTNIIINNTSGIVFNKSLIIIEYSKQ